MFRFVKQIFVSAMMFFGCNVSGVNSLNAVSKCISMNDQECKSVNKVLILTAINLHFILTVLKLINPVEVVIILMVHIQNYAFLMLLKT